MAASPRPRGAVLRSAAVPARRAGARAPRAAPRRRAGRVASPTSRRWWTGRTSRARSAATFADLREGLRRADAAVGAEAGARGRRRAGAAGRGARRRPPVCTRAYCRELAGARGADARGVLRAAAAGATGDDARRTSSCTASTTSTGAGALVGALLAAGADAFVPVPRERRAESAPRFSTRRSAAAVSRSAARERGDLRADRGARRRRSGAPSGGPRSSRSAGDGTLQVVSVAGRARRGARGGARRRGRGGAGRPLFTRCAVRRAARRRRRARSRRRCVRPGFRVACRRARPVRRAPRVLLRLAGLSGARRSASRSRGAPSSICSRRRRCEAPDRAPVTSLCGSTRPARPAWWAGSEQWQSASTARRRHLERRVAELEAARLDGGRRRAGGESLERARAAPRAAVAAWRPRSARWRGSCRSLPAARRLGELGGGARPAWPRTLFAAEAAASARDAAGRPAALDVARRGRRRSARRSPRCASSWPAARVPQGRVGRDGVAVLTPLECRGLSFHTVVFTGLAEGGFPARGRPDPLLGDAERAAARARRSASGCRSPSSATPSPRCCSPSPARPRASVCVLRRPAHRRRHRPPAPAVALSAAAASLAAGRPVGLDEFLDRRAARPRLASRRRGAPAFAGDDVVWVDERERDAAALLALSERGRADGGRVRYLAAVLAASRPARRRLGAVARRRAARSRARGTACSAGARRPRSPRGIRSPPSASHAPRALHRAALRLPAPRRARPRGPRGARRLPRDGAREFGSLAHAILQRRLRGA